MKQYYTELNKDEIPFHSLPLLFSSIVEIPEDITSLVKIEVFDQENARSKIHINNQYSIISFGKHISRTIVKYPSKR